MKVMVFDITEDSKPTTAISNISIKKTKYFIGKIEIPFSLITVMPAISGLFRLDRPLVIFSYGLMKKEMFGS